LDVVGEHEGLDELEDLHVTATARALNHLLEDETRASGRGKKLLTIAWQAANDVTEA